MTLRVLLCTSALFLLALSELNIQQVCNEVQDSDDVVRNHLTNPVEANCEKIFDDLHVYFDKVEHLIKSLQQDKNTTIDLCRDLVMDGEPRFILNVEFDYWKLMDGFKWNMTQVMNYMDWRDKTLYLWQRVDEASGRNSVYPKLR